MRDASCTDSLLLTLCARSLLHPLADEVFSPKGMEEGYYAGMVDMPQPKSPGDNDALNVMKTMNKRETEDTKS